MDLYSESEGVGETVVILHGLMGSCENWRSVRAALADRYRVVCVDLPNHGRSPHAARTDLRSMGDDVFETLHAQGIDGRVLVIGHSMGGKVAMQMAADYADRIRGLVVVDISPRAMHPVHLFVLRACQQLDLTAATRRSDYQSYINSNAWKTSPARMGELEAAGNRCRICNRSADEVRLEVHHRTYENFGREVQADLTALCSDCHLAATSELRNRCYSARIPYYADVPPADPRMAPFDPTRRGEWS